MREQSTPEQKKEKAIDARFYEVGRRIAQYDQLFEEIRILKSEIKKIFSSQQSHESHCLENEKKNSFLFNQLESFDDLSESRFKNILDRLDSMTQQLRNVEEKSHAMESEILLQIEKIKELEKSISKIEVIDSEIKWIKSTFFKEMGQFKTDISESTQISKTLKKELEQIDERQKFLCDEGNRLNEKLNQSQNLIFEERNQRKDQAQSFINYLESQLSEQRIKFDRQISSLKIPSPHEFPSKEQVIKIESQINSIHLDSKNASLKASNTEIQLQLLAKKIENIFLTLKGLELKEI